MNRVGSQYDASCSAENRLGMGLVCACCSRLGMGLACACGNRLGIEPELE